MNLCNISTEFAIGPLTSRFCEGLHGGMHPSVSTTFGVGRKLYTPQNATGILKDPAKSDPSANGTIPTATAAADPPLEPPLVNVSSFGLFVLP
jgi:hypothetical protein